MSLGVRRPLSRWEGHLGLNFAPSPFFYLTSPKFLCREASGGPDPIYCLPPVSVFEHLAAPTSRPLLFFEKLLAVTPPPPLHSPTTLSDSAPTQPAALASSAARASFLHYELPSFPPVEPTTPRDEASPHTYIKQAFSKRKVRPHRVLLAPFRVTP